MLEAALGRAFLFYPATSSFLSMIITCHLPIVSSSLMHTSQVPCRRDDVSWLHS